VKTPLPHLNGLTTRERRLLLTYYHRAQEKHIERVIKAFEGMSAAARRRKR
jgi:hypothetical protein